MTPLVIDPQEGRPPLIGSRWQRRESAGDAWDLCEVAGVFDLGADHGGLELVVRPVEFTGEPALTTSAESLSENYQRVGEDDDDGAAVKAADALKRLEATVAT